MIGAAETAQRLADDALAAARQRAAEVTGALESLAAQVPAIASPAQAHGLIAQAEALQQRADTCAAETAQAGRAGVEQAADAAGSAQQALAMADALSGPIRELAGGVIGSASRLAPEGPAPVAGVQTVPPEAATAPPSPTPPAPQADDVPGLGMVERILGGLGFGSGR